MAATRNLVYRFSTQQVSGAWWRLKFSDDGCGRLPKTLAGNMRKVVKRVVVAEGLEPPTSRM
jgi:hypothetical protein